MTTKEVANRLVELCRAGQFDQCYHEIFHEDAAAYEMPGFPHNAVTKGRGALLAKSEAFSKGMKEFHGVTITDPLVHEDVFAVGMTIDVTREDGNRVQESEICTYVVKDGKISSEHFTYAM